MMKLIDQLYRKSNTYLLEYIYWIMPEVETTNDIKYVL
mgnify:CR=1 FL=1